MYLKSATKRGHKSRAVVVSAAAEFSMSKETPDSLSSKETPKRNRNPAGASRGRSDSFNPADRRMFLGLCKCFCKKRAREADPRGGRLDSAARDSGRRRIVNLFETLAVERLSCPLKHRLRSGRNPVWWTLVDRIVHTELVDRQVGLGLGDDSKPGGREQSVTSGRSTF